MDTERHRSRRGQELESSSCPLLLDLQRAWGGRIGLIRFAFWSYSNLVTCTSRSRVIDLGGNGTWSQSRRYSKRGELINTEDKVGPLEGWNFILFLDDPDWRDIFPLQSLFSTGLKMMRCWSWSWSKKTEHGIKTSEEPVELMNN